MPFLNHRLPRPEAPRAADRAVRRLRVARLCAAVWAAAWGVSGCASFSETDPFAEYEPFHRTGAATVAAPASPGATPHVAAQFPSPPAAERPLVVRGQNAGGNALPTLDPRSPPRPGAPAPAGSYPAASYPATNFAPPPATLPAGTPPPSYTLPPGGAPAVVGGPGNGPLVSDGFAPGLTPLVPGQVYQTLPPGASPTGPFSEDEFIDLFPQVSEAPTGRIMLGVGYNSDAGLLGSFVVDEQNFDWQRWPTSWDDVRNATAFRGAGQQLRFEAQPGDQVQRYTISFREPYLFNTRVSLGLSAFLYDRIYTNWREERLGGKVTLGYQLRPDWSVAGSLGAQNVNIRDPAVPTPADLTAALGNNDIYTAGVKITNDTRDSAFLPTEGHLLELNLEQNFGEWDFYRLTGDVRQYFLLYQRADGSGRHVLGVHGRVGFSGDNTPIFERFYAGGTSTLRGFDFRGASPREFGQPIGGNFMLLGSVEYLMPLTADDMLRAVAFCDFGTVESTSRLDTDTFRVAPGFGFRVVVPALGPAPLAFDFAFPINKVDGDDTRTFSFTVGLFN